MLKPNLSLSCHGAEVRAMKGCLSEARFVLFFVFTDRRDEFDLGCQPVFGCDKAALGEGKAFRVKC